MTIEDIRKLYSERVTAMVIKELEHMDKMNPKSNLTKQHKLDLAIIRVGDAFKKVIKW